MSGVFMLADPHFSHENSCTLFKRPDGTPLRPFADADEMDEAMVERWNAKVSVNSKVYILGDVAINKKKLPILDRLNGSKRLVMGNHDIFGVKEYLKYFKEIYACRVLEGMILTHIPIHVESIARFGCNVHGHLHCHEVMVEVPEVVNNRHTGETYGIMHNIPDPRYVCVSVEHTDYTPLSIEEVRERIKTRQEAVGYVPPSKVTGNGPT